MSKLIEGKLPSKLEAVSVIMAGGSGTRFWPLSRSARPKQYLALSADNKSLIQLAAERVQPVTGEGSVIVATGEGQRHLVAQQLPNAGLIVEPMAKNTAPCVGLAAMSVLETFGDVPMLCLPADHLIQNTERVRDLYREALALAASENVLVTMGIQPTGPETGYGYLEQGEPWNNDAGIPAQRVQRFIEKPSREKAEHYLQQGNYFWNSGMFAWRPTVVLEAFSQFLPKTLERLETLRQCTALGQANAAKIFSQIDPISIDYGIMEKADNVVMLPGVDLGWSDVGSWSAWAEVVAAANPGTENVFTGEGFFVDSKRCATYSEGRFVAVVGVNDLIIVETPDAILVCAKDKAQEVKQVVEHLKKQKRDDLL